MNVNCKIKIYVVSQPEPADPLGFGKHAALSYSEVKNKHPQYCEWAVTTAREGPCDPRLKRFAGWSSNDPQLHGADGVTRMGAQDGTIRGEPPSGDAQAIDAEAEDDDEEQRFFEEVSILKGERARKKAQNEEALSVVSDFSM
ncbi:unnamed protein product, partial [Symbiodinium sp. KB8]